MGGIFEGFELALFKLFLCWGDGNTRNFKPQTTLTMPLDAKAMFPSTSLLILKPSQPIFPSLGLAPTMFPFVFWKEIEKTLCSQSREEEEKESLQAVSDWKGGSSNSSSSPRVGWREEAKRRRKVRRREGRKRGDMVVLMVILRVMDLAYT